MRSTAPLATVVLAKVVLDTTVLVTAGLALFTDTATAQQLCGKPVAHELLTTPERGEWKRTSTAREVDTFLAAVAGAFPNKFELSTIGRTLSARPIRLVVFRRKAAGVSRLRVLIQGNIVSRAS